MNVGKEREKEVKDGFSIFVLSSWKDGVSLTELRKAKDRAGMEKGERELHIWTCYVEISISHTRGNANRPFNIQV